MCYILQTYLKVLWTEKNSGQEGPVWWLENKVLSGEEQWTKLEFCQTELEELDD